MRRLFLALALIAMGACADGNGSVVVSLTEHEIDTESASAGAGEIQFDVANNGEEIHEIVIVRTDLEPDKLPKADDGSFNEEQIEVVDEIEDIGAGASESLTVDLSNGQYVLACNVVEEEEGETEAHYSLGMHRAFEVS